MAQLDLEDLAARDPVERGQLASSEVVASLRSRRRSRRTRDPMDAVICHDPGDPSPGD